MQGRKENRMKTIVSALLCILMTVPVCAEQSRPGEGVSVQPARATWDTGYFQEALVRAGLTELGWLHQQRCWLLSATLAGRLPGDVRQRVGMDQQSFSAVSL